MAETAMRRARTCIGCGMRADKVDLYRIVRTSAGEVRFDATGRLAGRGAYVCSAACFEKARARGALGRALRCSVESGAATAIATELEGALESARVR